MKMPSYNVTPLMEQINKQMIQQKHSNTFVIANFGEGPLLTYRGAHSRISVLSVCLVCESKHIEFSHFSDPPYLIAFAQEKPDIPIFTVIYHDKPDAILEQGMEHKLTGQILACGYSPDGNIQTLVHATYLPEHSKVFACVNRSNSILLERHPEVCGHVLSCGAMIDALLHKDRREHGHED